jgi:predicted dienelactone hydrolase
MRRATLIVVAAAAFAGSQANAQMGQGVVIPATPFSKPTGPYGVGTRDYYWVDATRPELFTKDSTDRRHLMVQIWYPADISPGATPARYVRNPDEFANPAEFKPVLHVTTNAVLDAPVAGAEGKYPVLLYNHGGGWNRFSATFTVEQLASHGYVVVSVEHPGFSKIAAFPDGYRFVGDTLQFKPTGKMKDDGAVFWAWLDNVVFVSWIKDATFALDKIEELNRDPASPLAGRLDLGHIGALGWSFGGAVAIELSRSDPRIKAAVDHDGQLGGAVRDLGTGRPYMQLHNTSDPLAGLKPEDVEVMKEAVDRVHAWDRALKEKSTNDWYDVEIKGTTHGSFSDLMLFFPSEPGQIDPRRAHEIINAYTLAFLDQYLRGKTSPLLAAPSPSFPEATFTKKP